MRTTIKIDSATPAEVYHLTLAFQRTRDMGLPQQLCTEPRVTVAGVAMGWESPAMSGERAVAVMREFDRLERGLFDDGAAPSLSAARDAIASTRDYIPSAARDGAVLEFDEILLMSEDAIASINSDGVPFVGDSE